MDAERIEALRASAQKTEKAFSIIQDILKESVVAEGRVLFEGKELSVELLKERVELQLSQDGMHSSEGMIISPGLQAVNPHYPGEGPVLPYVPLVCDIYPKDKENGYFADLTRTFCKGEPSQTLQDMYGAVLEAQERGIQAVKPGVPASEVHGVVASFLREKGYDVGEKGFVHATGHGVGLEVHEDPRIGEKSEAVLEPGQVITIEPGLYYPQVGGIRLEDMVLVTEQGAELLSSFPRQPWVIP